MATLKIKYRDKKTNRQRTLTHSITEETWHRCDHERYCQGVVTVHRGKFISYEVCQA